LAITRQKKETILTGYAEQVRRSQALIVSEYRGLTVKQLESLRRELRGCDSELVVPKNTLILRSLREAGLAAPEPLFSGPTAVAFCYGDLAAPAKALTKFAKDSKVLVLRGGVLGQSSFSEAGIQALTELPGRDQLRGQVVGVLQGPISGLVNVLAGPVRAFMTVLHGRIGQLEERAA
jgi:large subunit ribosomal protein L10